MRFAFVIGNGFDLNFGLDVKYSDFYAHINATQPLDAGTNVEQRIIWKEILQDLEKYSAETKKVKTDSDIALWGGL